MYPPTRLLAALALLSAPLDASAATRLLAPVSVRDAWVQTPLKGSLGTAVYLAIRNNTQRPERLMGASTPAGTALTLHSMSMAGGIMRMRKLDGGLPIAPGTTVALKPGGDHLMLTGITRKLQPGDRVAITLRFENAGERTLAAPVRSDAPSR